MSQNGAIAALPTTGNADKAALRNHLVKRIIFPLADAEDPEDFEALDAETGALPEALAWQSIIFWLDPDDATSAHDGITVLVTADDYRYKIPEYAGFKIAALDKDLTAPPGSPAFDDAYLVPAAATGDWAGKTDKIAVYTARGWKFITPQVGRILYLEDEDAYYHWSEAGSWVAGFGDSLLSAKSVLPSHLLGGRTRWIVENQTTNAPPGSPADEVQYIIGPSPTGAWAGNAGKLAMARGGSWIITTPLEGTEAFDKAGGANYVYRSSAWQSAAGSYVDRFESAVDALTNQTVEDNGSATNTTTGYSYSATTAPTATAVGRVIDNYQPTVAAKRAGAAFELDIWGRLSITMAFLTVGGSSRSMTLSAIALFVDSETNAREWHEVTLDNITVASTVGSNGSATAEGTLYPKKFRFTLADTADHTIKIRYFFRCQAPAGYTVSVSSVALRRKRFIIREAA